MESLERQKHPCDFNCFRCKYGDCIRGAAEIIAHEAEVSGREIHTSRVYKKREIEQGGLYGPLWLREKRQGCGMTMREIAKEIGVSASTYVAWENGKKRPSKENMEKIKKLGDALC